MSEIAEHKHSIPSKYVEVFGSKMHYLEEGSGDPILFLHGIPMSSFLWRKLFPHLKTLGRCIAPDLIGCGKSEKPNIEYTVKDHIKYIEKFIETLDLKNITLIMQGWGSLIGLDYAMRHEKNCKGLVFYEAFLKSVNDNESSLPFYEQLLTLTEECNAAELSSNGTALVDKILLQRSLNPLPPEVLNQYREPFQSKGSVKPILAYIKELPKGDGTSEIDKLIAGFTMKLTHSHLPKLLLYSTPGFITTMALVMWARENIPNIEITEVGEELHLAQESNSELMGESISVWLQGIEQL